MYVYIYINFEQATIDGKIDHDKEPAGWFKFNIAKRRQIRGRIGDNGRAYVECRKALPEEVEPYFLGCSERVTWETQAHRYTGVYRLDKAVGTLERVRRTDTSNNENGFGYTIEAIYHEYVLEVEADTVEGCQELVQMIRAGKIFPTENWEAEQARTRTLCERINSWFRWNRRELNAAGE